MKKNFFEYGVSALLLCWLFVVVLWFFSTLWCIVEYCETSFGIHESTWEVGCEKLGFENGMWFDWPAAENERARLDTPGHLIMILTLKVTRPKR